MEDRNSEAYKTILTGKSAFVPTNESPIGGSDMMKPLDGLRVLDLTRVAAGPAPHDEGHGSRVLLRLRTPKVGMIPELLRPSRTRRALILSA